MPRPHFLAGRRGKCLMFFALLDLLYGLSLWQPAAEAQRSASTRFLMEVAPLPWWAGLWLAAGVICLVGAIHRRGDRLAFAAAIGIKTLWGTVFLLGWRAGAIERGWVAAVVWLAFALMVGVLAGWPDPPRAATAGK